MSSSSTTRIQTLDSYITVFSRPFNRFGVFPVGIRMSAVRLRNGDLFLLSPTPLDDSTAEKLNNLGKVKFLVCPNVVHHLYVGDYKKKWPDAKVIGVKGLKEKRKDVEFDGIMGQDNKTYGFEDEIEYRHFSASRNQDTLYLHRPSNTLLTADLMFNMPPTEQYPPNHRFNFLLRSMYGALKPGTLTHKIFTRYAMATDSKQMKEDVKFVAENWRFERIVPCHGNVLESGAEKAFREAFAWYF